MATQIAQAGGELVAEFQEVESGKRADRPQLAAALAACRRRRAVLVIAKLDRLARNARFLLSIVEGSGEAGVVFCDLPTVPAGPVGKFLITQMAAVAELEAGLISQRTRAALAVAKARGVTFGKRRGGRRGGGQVQTEGTRSLRGIAAELQAHGVLTPAGKTQWSATQVRRLLAGLGP